MTGYDGKEYHTGDRIELNPCTDLWMRGARYGVVVGTSLTKRDKIKFKLDKTGDKVYSGEEDLVRIIK